MATTMKNNNKELNPAQLTAIAQLILGANYSDAATAAGVNVATLRNWRRNDPVFSAELAQQKKEVMSQSMGKLTDQAGKSIETLIEIRDNKEGSQGLRFKAASKLLDLALHVSTVEELQSEIDRLNRRLNESGR